LLLLHYPFLRLPYFWDEAGYYVPAALDFYEKWLLVPERTLPTGHTPLVVMYLGLAWWLFGFSPLVTRVAMVLVAAATTVVTYRLARRIMGREPAVWSSLLMALSPLFFAQSSLVHLDLPAALFTALAVLALLDRRYVVFAITASLAVLTKETAIILLPVAWFHAGWRQRGQLAKPSREPFAPQPEPQPGVLLNKVPLLLTFPLAPLLLWSLFYHHHTGYWTGNAEYLDYNLYSALDPVRIVFVLLRRLYQLFIGGFNWVPVLGALAGLWWRRRQGLGGALPAHGQQRVMTRNFLFVALWLSVMYVLAHSVVGGAILRRYLLPIWPAFITALVICIWNLPRLLARSISATATVCFVASWFVNPPYPFPWEENLAYADFVRLHQQAATYLEYHAEKKRILTAWPATDELTRPFLGYVRKPLTVVPVEGFARGDFAEVTEDSFDLLYLYSRGWEPQSNQLLRWPWFQRYFHYSPQMSAEELSARFSLKRLQTFEGHGQWVHIYRRPCSEKRKSDVNSCPRIVGRCETAPLLGIKATAEKEGEAGSGRTENVWDEGPRVALGSESWGRPG